MKKSLVKGIWNANEKARKMKKSILFRYLFLPLPSAKLIHAWFEFFPSYLSRKKEISETFLGLGLRPRPQKTFPQFPFFYFGNLGKTQIRRGKILLQTWHGKKSKQNTIVACTWAKDALILIALFNKVFFHWPKNEHLNYSKVSKAWFTCSRRHYFS